MGYYTEHTLEVRGIKNKDQFEKLQQYLREKELIGYAFTEGRYPATVSIPNPKDAIFFPYDSCKWYDHAVDMVHVSEKFPFMTFELSGSGEDPDDLWKEYYHDGETEACRGEIVYEQPKRIQWQELRRF